MSKLQQALAEGNVRKVRSFVTTKLSTDPLDRSKELENAIKVIDASGLQVWDQHDGTALKQDQAAWTKDYVGELQSHLITNFSKEALQHALAVAKYAYREELKQKPQPQVPPRQPQNGPRGQQPRGTKQGKGKTLLFVGLGAVVVIGLMWIYLRK